MPNTKPEPFDPSVYLHSPADLGNLHLEHYHKIKANPGIKFQIPSLDRYCIPLRPGDLITVIGRPGHGKSSLLARQAKVTANDIAMRGAQLSECVIYISWEQHAEELEAYFEADSDYTVSDYAWGRVSVEQVEQKSMHRAKLPLWMIGHSGKNVARQTIPLTLSVVFQAIESMAHTFEKSPKPILMCFDYAQLIPDEGRHRNRYEEVAAAIRATKHLALRIGCPALIGVQARREVDDRQIPIPGMNDGYESSGLEHVPDKIFGIWRPYKTHRNEESVQIAPGVNVPVKPETFIMRMSKQRLEDGERTFVLHFSMSELRLADLEIDRTELDF